MNGVINEMRRNSVIRFLASIKITCACLFLLFILTFWGTVAQVDNGLYAAQDRFFNSYFFLIGGFLPFPGAQMVLWVLFLNLLAAAPLRMVLRWSHLGILITHAGLLIYFVAAFVTLHQTVESSVTLRETEATNLSQSYGNWELSLWQGDGGTRTVTALDTGELKSGDQITFGPHLPAFTVAHYYRNSEAYQGETTGPTPLNASGITVLKDIAPDKEPGRNFPGLMMVPLNMEKPAPVIVYGGEPNPTAISLNGQNYNVQLRRKRWPLPFLLTLKDFRMERHPNTEVARSYESTVTISHDNVTRDILISMNEPLRFKDFTLYQSSYAIDQMGRESSTLAVVKNSGRILPYVASLLTFAGLAVHFLTMAFVPAFQKARMRI